jgi:hypothetical protein
MRGMQRWEYLFFRINAYEGKVADRDSSYRDQYLHQLLPKLGAEGWELVCVVSLGGDFQTMFFKRPVAEPSE